MAAPKPQLEARDAVYSPDMSFHATGMSRMRPRTYFILFISLMLGACVHAPAQPSSAQNSVKETSTMTTSASPDAVGQDTSPLHPKLTPEQGLTRLLELIRNSRDLSEFTPERMNQALRVEVVFSNGDYGFGEQVTPQWAHNFVMHKELQRFEFSFDPMTPGTSPEVTDICQLDFDKFSDELVAMGFAREPYYDSAPPAPFGEERLPHGRLMYYSFNRMKDGLSEMTIHAYLQGEANDPPEKVRHDCIKMIHVF